MSWIKLDDQWMDHPKIIRAGRDARDMWLASITWCAKHLTDGEFPAELLPTLAAMAGVNQASVKQIAKVLLEVCLWGATENGYSVHDYADYNPTRAEALAVKNARSEAGRRGAEAKQAKSWQNPSKPLANGVANDKQKSAPSPSPFPLINTTTTATEGEPETPKTDPNFANCEDPKIYRIVTELTSWVTIPQSPENMAAIRNLQGVALRHRDDLKEYLAPFWAEWHRRYPNSNRMGWTEWAATGKIPDDNNTKQPPARAARSPARNPSLDVIEEARRRVKGQQPNGVTS